MAIDTAEKRKCISGILPYMVVGVTPALAQDREWRVELGWGYMGVAGFLLAITPLHPNTPNITHTPSTASAVHETKTSTAVHRNNVPSKVNHRA